MIHNSRRLVYAPLKGTPVLSPTSSSSRWFAKSLTPSSSHSSFQSPSPHSHESTLPVHPTRSHISRPASPSRSSFNVRPKSMPKFRDRAMYTPTFSDPIEPSIPTCLTGSTEQPTSLPEQTKSLQQQPGLSPSVSDSSSASASLSPSTSTMMSSTPALSPTATTSPSPPSPLPSLPSPSKSVSSPSSPSPSSNETHVSPSNVPPSTPISEVIKLSADELARLPADERAYLVALQSISNSEELARFLTFAKAWVKVGKRVPEPTGWVVAGKLPLNDSLKILRSNRQYEIGRIPSSKVAQILLRKLLEEIRKPRMLPLPVNSMAILDRIYNLWPRSQNIATANPSSASSPISLESENPPSNHKVTVSFVEDPLSWALLINAYSLILNQDRYPFRYNFVQRDQESNSSSTFGIKENLQSLRNYKLEDRLAVLGSTWPEFDIQDEEGRMSIRRVVDGFSQVGFTRFEGWFDTFKNAGDVEGGIWAWRYRLESMVLGRIRPTTSLQGWTPGVDMGRLVYPCLPSVQSPQSTTRKQSTQSTTTATTPSPPRLTPLIQSFHIPLSSVSSNPFKSGDIPSTTIPTAKRLVSELRSSFIQYPSDPILLLFAFRLAFRISPSDPDRSTLLSDLLSRVRPPVSWNQVMKFESEGMTGSAQRKRRQWTRKVVREGLDELGGVLKGRLRLWEDLLNS